MENKDNIVIQDNKEKKSHSLVLFYKNLTKENKVIIGMVTVILVAIIVLVSVNYQSISAALVKNFSKKSTYISLLKGLGYTLLITAGAFIMGLILGTLVCLIKGTQSQNVFVLILKQIAKVYVALFRSTPVMVQLLIVYYIVFASSTLNPVYVGMLTFGFNSGSYVSEIIRGGIQSVPVGQMQAGRSLGLSYRSVMTRIILPQSFKNCFPSLCNEFVTLIKETSVVGFIGATDLTLAFRNIANATFDYVTVYLIMGLSYLILVLFFTWILNLIERKVFKK